MNRNKNILVLLFALSRMHSTLHAQPIPVYRTPEKGYTKTQLASGWQGAMLSGNGSTGALVMGWPDYETILLAVLPEKDGYDNMRQPFIPAFSLIIGQQQEDIRRYQRSANFKTGEVTVDWNNYHRLFQRRVFVSAADSILVMQIRSDQKIFCTLLLAPPPAEPSDKKIITDGTRETVVKADSGWLSFRCGWKEKNKKGQEGVEGLGRLILKGGRVKTENGLLTVTDADEVLLLVKISASRNYDVPQLEKMKQSLLSKPGNYDSLLQRHIKKNLKM